MCVGKYVCVRVYVHMCVKLLQYSEGKGWGPKMLLGDFRFYRRIEKTVKRVASNWGK